LPPPAALLAPPVSAGRVRRGHVSSGPISVRWPSTSTNRTVRRRCLLRQRKCCADPQRDDGQHDPKRKLLSGRSPDPKRSVGRHDHVSTTPRAFVSSSDENARLSIRWAPDGAAFGRLIAACGLHLSYADAMSWRDSCAHQVGFSFSRRLQLTRILKVGGQRRQVGG
jgi:hypothetical protein